MLKGVPILRWTGGPRPVPQADELAAEEPLEIRVENRPVCVTLRTPGDDADLAAGFLLTEGIIHSRNDIAGIKPYLRNEQGNVINVFLSPRVTVDYARLTRQVFVSSSCGLCGKATIAAVRQQFKPVRTGLRVNAKTLLLLPDKLREKQEAFDRTGGLHAAAIFNSRGRLMAAREDIGRHNAVDKLLGHGLLQGRLPWDRHILMVSGRASFEIMQKALAARIPVVCAVSAPSSLAVEFARESRQTLVGFLRGDRMNLYSRPERIRF